MTDTGHPADCFLTDVASPASGTREFPTGQMGWTGSPPRQYAQHPHWEMGFPRTNLVNENLWPFSWTNPTRCSPREGLSAATEAPKSSHPPLEESSAWSRARARSRSLGTRYRSFLYLFPCSYGKNTTEAFSAPQILDMHRTLGRQ